MIATPEATGMVRVVVNREPLEVTNLDKVLYPSCGFRKGDVLSYYQAISPVMLPHLARRPVTVKRYPDGVGQEFFYEKRCPAKRPPWMATATATSDRHGSIEFCTIDNAQSLVWMANRAAIEYHTYLYRAEAEDQPTMMVFDLDPGAPATLLDCLEVGAMVRGLLAQLGLESFAKTSGGKGLHLGVPLRGARFAEVKGFARSVADLLAREEPQRVTSTMSKAQRPGRVFIDWSQNDHGKTTACAYTLRALERPLVSTPVTWEEIERARRRKKADLLRFEAAQVLRRVADIGDPFAATLTLRQRLPRLKSPVSA
jgi:bifunctional non-homologous end joining protein LigD